MGRGSFFASFFFLFVVFCLTESIGHGMESDPQPQNKNKKQETRNNHSLKCTLRV